VGAVRALDEDRQAGVGLRAADADVGLSDGDWGGLSSADRAEAFFALDASGKPLWQFKPAARSDRARCYAVGDRQFVAVAGGHALFVFALDQS
jgi:hypothetical protein